MKTHYTIGFENEVILLDKDTSIPAYTRDGKIVSMEILSVIADRYPDIYQLGGITPELDACQIEITNIGGKISFEQAHDELLGYFRIVQKIANELGYIISPTVVPTQDFETISSGGETHYQDIIDKLKLHGKEKSTNIAGLHCNISIPNKYNLLKLHNTLSQNTYNLLTQGNLDMLGMSHDRYQHYLDVVQVLQMDYLPKFDINGVGLEQLYLDHDGKPKSSYELVRLKYLETQNIYISELRTPDAGVSEKDLSKKMTKAFSFISNIND